MSGKYQKNAIPNGKLMRIRVIFSKLEPIRFSGHLDLQRLWERLFRRTRLPVEYSQGFNPQVRIQIACALPLGFTSNCELLDFWLSSNLEPSDITLALIKASPPGIRILNVEAVEQKSPPLQTLVIACNYTVTLLKPADINALRQNTNQFLASETIIRTRHGKTYDLRPLVESLAFSLLTEDAPQFQMRLAARQNATGRPEEVLAALELDPLSARYHRTDLILSNY
jgi:radical SAM-linked protein